MERRRWVLVLLGLGLSGSAACLHCGTGPTPAGAPDAQVALDATDRDVPHVLNDGGHEDTGAESDSGKIGACDPEPGWRVVPTEGPGCTVLAPDDVHARVTNPMWIACTNGRAGCQELERMGPAIPRPNPLRASFLGRALDKKQLVLEWERAVSSKYGPCLRSVVIDLANVEAPEVLAAWDGTSVASDGLCLGQLVPSTGQTGLIFSRNTTTSIAMGADLSMQKISAKSHIEDGNHGRATPSLLATRNAGVGKVFRMPFGSNQAITVPTPAGVSALVLDMVEGNDAFAMSEYGTANWMQWYRADADGQARLVLARPTAHVFHLRSDGTSLFWLEGSGNPGNFWPQPKVEVWTGTYSPDLDAIRNSAHLVKDVSGTQTRVVEAIAFGGFYAFAGVVEFVEVVRGSDGATQTINIGPNRRMVAPLYVSSTEVWVHYFVDANTTGIERIRLAAWP